MSAKIIYFLEITAQKRIYSSWFGLTLPCRSLGDRRHGTSEESVECCNNTWETVKPISHCACVYEVKLRH